MLLFYIDHISSNHLNLGCCTTAGAFDKAALLIKWLSALIHQVGLENTNWKFAPNIHYVVFYFQAFKCFSWGHSTNGVTLEYNRRSDKPRRTTQYRLPTVKIQFLFCIGKDCLGLIGHIIKLRFLICPALYIFVAMLIRILPTNINFSTPTNPAKAILRTYFIRISKLFFLPIFLYSIFVCTYWMIWLQISNRR